MKSNYLILTIAVSIGLSITGCSREEAPSAPSIEAAPATETSQGAHPSSGHAPAEALPGSHEDWCVEHQVPESMCTRCNPSLIAAFKATGDWCAEHGLPESQCLKCTPDLKIVRPPKGE